MIHKGFKTLRSLLFAGLLLTTSLTVFNCSGTKKESNATTTTDSTSSQMMGRQMDTSGSSMNTNQQAPPDSDQMRGATVPANVKVIEKKK